MSRPLILHHKIEDHPAGARSIGVVEIIAHIAAAPGMTQPLNYNLAQHEPSLLRPVLLPVAAAAVLDAALLGRRQRPGARIDEVVSAEFQLLDDLIRIHGI